MSREAKVRAQLTDLVKLLKSIETPDGASSSGSDLKGLVNEIDHLIDQKFPLEPHLKSFIELN
ncbi:MULTISPECIES: hypothetical protein [Rahnella]|uniref:hypothetical protein n=1 Tax=Rahnella TaxID=34037 RepID=UPI00104D5908|nr:MULTISPECIES: hypothetical protein [Rahnella]TCQ90234.1 hypothetical protein EC840_10326 [Rahnella sp. JUb53]